MNQNHILYLFSIIVCFSCATNTLETVKVSERQLLLNNQPYTIKGICYHPVPKGSEKRDFGNLTEDLALMVEASINTIRVYEPIEEVVVLDEIHKAGIKVIVGFGYNQGGKNDILSGTFINYVNKFKNHNAILFWELGNEYNYHPEWFNGDVKNWYKAMHKATDLIHKNDTSHPVATAHGELPDSLALAMNPNIDVWGMNVYRWDIPETIFPQWEKISKKPMYLSEAGADSYMKIAKDEYKQGINEKAQADATSKIMNAIFNTESSSAQEVCLGVAMFSFTDGWWKAGNPDVQDVGGWAPNSSGVPYDGVPNEEYWGIVDINRKKKQAYTVVKEKYNSLDNK
ncbi:MAG: glycoside hydrolase family 2 TIM barrel-domain containing protein [Polaribacter sp.]